MKKLKKIKLINWHRFVNETIKIHNSVLLSGENGAGKSTILDAIQLVLTCSKSHFNKAANEKSKRNLVGYVRYKTGKEDKPFERTGFITSHIALEFLDEDKNKSFIIGAVIDSSSDVNEKTIWYRIDNSTIDDEIFMNGKAPKSIDEFKRKNNIKSFSSMAEAKRNFRLVFGNVNDKFFELIPKAIAFKPIDDIKEFVYSYVLDKKEVRIDELKNNVRAYQEFEQVLKTIKIKMSKLEAINNDYEEIVKNKINVRKYEYYKSRIAELIKEEEISGLERSIKKAELAKEDLEKRIIELTSEIINQRKTKSILEDELINNKDYRALRRVEESIANLKVELKEIKFTKNKFDDELKKVIKNINEIKASNIELDEVEELSNKLEEYSKVGLKEGLEIEIDSFIKVRDGLKSNYLSEKTRAEIEKEKKQEDKKLLYKKITDLEKKKLDYDAKVIKLIDEIQSTFKRASKTVEPKILCEMLTITDEAWKNAVEGYLNTQRFYILVAPEDFDLAQKAYEKAKKEYNIHSIGLINTGGLEEFDNPKENSLATMVTSKSIWARRFINKLLNKVILCEKGEELKKHKCSITKDCMLYQNNVVRAINPEIYKKPYIGEDAYKIQLVQAKKDLIEVEEELKDIETQIDGYENSIKLLENEAIVFIKHNLDIVPKYIKSVDKLKALENDKVAYTKNNSLIKKQLLINSLEETIKDLEIKERTVYQNIGAEESTIKNTKIKFDYAICELEKCKRDTLEIRNQMTNILSDPEKECEKIIANKSLYKALEDTSQAKDRFTTRIDNITKDMQQKMFNYKSEHDFGGEASIDGAKEFIEEYDKLVKSEVLDYEEKVQKAKQNAELEFKEQFLSKIKENIITAQGEFKSLNRALKNVEFGNESYEFKYSESKKYSKYYKMIMDDLNMVEGFSLLSGEFNNKHQEVINELFERLTIDEEESFKALEEFTDYRTYMDYDILVKHADGSKTLYSKVSKEKSGGETQTPFYVTIAASFVQLYKETATNSIGIIMFDEAFDKMDDERINGILKFLTNLPLQIIIASPPEKIQYIGPKVNTNLLVLKDGKYSYVERFEINE